MTDAELVAVAIEAARAAAAELLGRFGSFAVAGVGPRRMGDGSPARQGVRTKSTPTDLVSDADVAAEKAIRRVLAARRPHDAVLGEEGGASGGDPGETEPLRWIVDPLDGTVNFLFGIPVFAVSVACEDDSGTRVGVVLDPVRDECFSATRSSAATLNGAAIPLAERKSSLELALVATGFAYDARLRARQGEVVARVLPRARDIRRAGAAALDLAWCACGRYDAYYERGVHVWDVTAGALICERAGLIVRELPAAGEDPEGLLAAPGAFVDELFSLVV